MNKRGQGTFFTIKNALLTLVVIAVVIGVFYVLLKEPIKGLLGIGEATANPNDELILKINNLLGSCNPDENKEPRCSFQKSVQCDAEGKWIVVGDC